MIWHRFFFICVNLHILIHFLKTKSFWIFSSKVIFGNIHSKLFLWKAMTKHVRSWNAFNHCYFLNYWYLHPKDAFFVFYGLEKNVNVLSVLDTWRLELHFAMFWKHWGKLLLPKCTCLELLPWTDSRQGDLFFFFFSLSQGLFYFT